MSGAAPVKAALLLAPAVLVATGCTATPDEPPTAPPSSTTAPEPAPSSPTTEPPADIPLQELLAARSSPVDDMYYPEQGEHYLDTLHYDLVLDWAVEERVLTGEATITFQVTEPRTEIQLDLAAQLSVVGATLDGQEVTTSATGDDLVVETGELTRREPHVLQLAYTGVPEPTPFPGSRPDIPALGWTTMPDGSVWTMQEPFGAFTWYPVNDHPSDKAFYDATITSDGGFTGVFNGSLVDTATEDDATRTSWHLDEPAASYLVTIAIGDYAATQDEGPNGLPITYWTEGQQQTGVLEESPQMLAWLVDLLGPYPFDTAGIVLVPADSAMETQTMVTLAEGLLTAGEYGRTVVLHEYAHQWLGDALTPHSWSDLWLNEGLTMYVQLLWEASVGLSDVDVTIAEWARRDTADRRAYGPPGAFAADEFASVNVYLSGAVMLHRIRREVGDKTFFAALRSWAQDHHGSNVDRRDFIESWSRSTGLRLGPFVQEWLTAPRTPTSGP